MIKSHQLSRLNLWNHATKADPILDIKFTLGIQRVTISFIWLSFNHSTKPPNVALQRLVPRNLPMKPAKGESAASACWMRVGNMVPAIILGPQLLKRKANSLLARVDIEISPFHRYSSCSGSVNYRDVSKYERSRFRGISCLCNERRRRRYDYQQPQSQSHSSFNPRSQSHLKILAQSLYLVI